MDEAARKQFCKMMMLEVAPPNPRMAGQQMPVMVDYTTSLETSSIQNDNFVYTSYVEPMSVHPSSSHRFEKNPRPKSPIQPSEPTTIFVDESNQKEKSLNQRTPRPPNAFILYRRAKQPDVIKKRGHTSNTKLSQILAEMWHNEPEEIKFQWKKAADQKKMEHSLKYPGYVYRPKKSGYESKKKGNKRNGGKKEASTSSSKNFEESLMVINTNNGTQQETTNLVNIANEPAITMVNVPYSWPCESLMAPPMVYSNGNDDGFNSYLKRRWEEYNWPREEEDYQYHKRQEMLRHPANFPDTHPFFLETVTEQESNKSINTTLVQDEYLQHFAVFQPVYDFHESPSSPYILENLDQARYPIDPIIQANLL